MSSRTLAAPQSFPFKRSSLNPPKFPFKFPLRPDQQCFRCPSLPHPAGFTPAKTLAPGVPSLGIPAGALISTVPPGKAWAVTSPPWTLTASPSGIQSSKEAVSLSELADPECGPWVPRAPVSLGSETHPLFHPPAALPLLLGRTCRTLRRGRAWWVQLSQDCCPVVHSLGIRLRRIFPRY